MIFYILLISIPFLAWIRPEWGNNHPVLLKDLCIAGIFFCNGVQLDFSQFGNVKSHLRPLLAIQFGSMVLIPLLAILLLLTVFPLLGIPSDYTPGVLFTSLLPITTTSCVAFCRLAGVPIFDALINAVIGNFLGMVILPLISPMLLLKKMDPAFSAAYEAIFTLVVLVMIPLFLGVFLKRFIPGFPRLHLAGLWMLLYIIYVSYCKSFILVYSIHESAIIPLFLGMLILHTAATYLAYIFGKFLEFSEEMRTTLLLTIPQKTIVLGIPVVDSLSGHGQHTAIWLVLILPLLFYNNIQYIVGGTIAWAYSLKNSQK